MNDEKVDGPRVAARILNRIPKAQREVLLKRMQARDPAALARLRPDLMAFEDIVRLKPRGIQLLIKEVDHRDLVLSFKLAGPDLKAALLKNMSHTKARLVLEDFGALGKVSRREAEDAQRRIVAKLDELRTAGLIIAAADGAD